MLAYHHDAIASAGQTGIYRDVSGAAAGATCTFGIFIKRSDVVAGKHGPDSIELRVESPHQGRQLQVATQT